MISMIWISQAALKFADADLCATIFFVLILMWFVVNFKCDEGGGVTGMLQHLIPSFLCIFASFSIWNNNTQCPDEKKTMNPKKEKKKETLPSVPLEDKKKNKKNKKRSQRKIVSMENKEPPVSKEKTKMYPSLESCKNLNMDARAIYNCLLQYKLTVAQLKMNSFPCEDYRPPTLVEVDDYSRICVRCNEQFEIYKGVYLSPTKCMHHPKRATFNVRLGSKIHSCCDSPVGSPPCSVSNHHVTLQHGPKRMTKTASRRHIRRDLQNRIFGLDCEMSYTTGGLEVTRICLVDIDGCTVYDSYVKPKNAILDYNTLYSGVEKKHLDRVTTSTDDVKEILKNFIHEDTILVGHALNNDLAALGLIHNTVVDTSVLYSNPVCPMKKKSLKSLASEYLGMSIQDDPSGHDCIEDARACLQLALLKVPPNPSEHSPFALLENITSRQRPLVEDDDFCGIQQQSPIGREDFIYEQEQQRPLMEIQNFNYRYFRPIKSPSVNFRSLDPSHLFPKLDNSAFRYDPSSGCYRNFLLLQTKRGV